MAKKSREERKASRIVIKWRKYAFANFILKFEYRAFGWAYTGKEVDVVDDGYETTVYDDHAVTKHKSHIVKHACFQRPRSYQKNFLFSLLELLSGIVSRFRVWALNLIMVPIIILVIALIGGGENTGTIIGVICGIYGGLIGASILFGILGLVVRKAFKLDEKTDEFNHKYGYQGQTDFIQENDVKYN